MKKYALLGALLLLQEGYSEGAIFSTLIQVQQLAESLPENLDPDADWVNPDFSSFHKKYVPGIIRRFINWFGLGKRTWNVQGFNTLLRSLTKQRELNGLMGDFIQKYRAAPGDHIFVWTDLFGAFHSLVRDLTELHARGIIDNQFKIIKPNYLFVFNGNVIDHSPYVLETLTLVMRLLEANPQQALYVRGDHEDKQEWHSYGLARELKIRAASLSREIIPLDKVVTKFFNTLPLGLFLPQVGEKEIEVVLIANSAYSRTGFDVKEFAGFLEKKENGALSSFKVSNTLTAQKPVRTKALISGEDRTITYHQTGGLTMLGMQQEALRWLNFSSPTGRNRRLYEFFYDALVEIDAVNQFVDWTITIYSQDVRKLLGFQKVATYNLLTGQRAIEGTEKLTKEVVKEEKKKEPVATPEKKLAPEDRSVPEKQKETAAPVAKVEVVVGSTIDLSKSASTIGKVIKEGLDIAFKKVADEGGVGSFLPRIIVQDDEYTPSKTRGLVQDFLDKKHIDIFVSSTGSPTLESYLDLVKEGKVLVLFPFTGAPLFRKPELKSIAHIRVGYVDEGRALAEYALDELRAKKMAIFYQNDAFGLGVLQGAMEVLKKRGKEATLVPYDRNDVAFEQQVKIIEETDPDTIFFFAVTPAARGLIRQLGVTFLRNRNLIGMSVYDKSFEHFLKSKGLSFVMVRMVPDPNTSELEIVKEYREAAKASNHIPSFDSLESFISSQVFFDILKRIQPPVTKEKLINEIEHIKNYDFKGITLNFNPQTRELGHTLWIDTNKGPIIKKEIKPSSEVPLLEKKIEMAKELPKAPSKEPVAADKKPEMPPQKAVVTNGEKKPIIVGSLIDLSKGIKQQGKLIKDGIELRVREAWDAGDQAISQVVIVDDEYTPAKTLREVKQFLEKGIDIVLAPIGSPTLESYLDLVKEGKILVLFPITGAPLFRQKDLKYMAHIRPSYKTEGKILTEYALDTLRTQKGAMFYQDDAFGQGLLEGAQEILKQKGVTNWLAVGYARNDVNFSKQVAAIKKYDPDTLLLFSTTTAAMELIRLMGITEISAKHIIANSDFGDEKLLRFMDDKGLKLIYLNVVPHPQRSTIGIMEQFRKAATKHGVSIDPFSFEAYMATDFFLAILKTIEGTVTKEKIIDAIEKVKDYDYKGLKFNFDPENRTLSSSFWMSTGTPDWQMIKAEK